MLRLLSALLGLAVLAVMLTAGGLLLLRDASPSLGPMPSITAEERRWAKSLIGERLLAGLHGGAAPEIELSGADLRVLSVLLAERVQDGRLRFDLGGGEAVVMASAPMPLGLGGWLNLEARLRGSAQGTRIDQVALGSLPIPAVLANVALQQVLAQRGLPTDLLNGVVLTGNRLRLQPARMAGAAADMLGDAFATQARERALEAQRRLAEIVAARQNQGWLDGTELLSALIASAPDAEGQAPAENRAAIIALAAYANGRTLSDPSGAVPPELKSVRMRGREDVAQHFFASAALVLQGGSRLSELIGEAKELSDADGGSGFSFRDLAADRAGQRFGELAGLDPSMAQAVRRMARDGLAENQVMPPIDGLPENMSLAELERDFGGRGGQAYQIVVDVIDRRIDGLALYRAAPDVH